MKKKYSGINIQWPISELILSKDKLVETRTYPIPEKYIGKELLLIETPGKKGKFKARISAIIVFEKSFAYKSKTAFYNDYKNHRVDKESIWAWSDDKPKYGWPIKKLVKLDKPLPLKKRGGIVFTKNISLEI